VTTSGLGDNNASARSIALGGGRKHQGSLSKGDANLNSDRLNGNREKHGGGASERPCYPEGNQVNEKLQQLFASVGQTDYGIVATQIKPQLSLLPPTEAAKVIHTAAIQRSSTVRKVCTILCKQEPQLTFLVTELCGKQFQARKSKAQECTLNCIEFCMELFASGLLRENEMISMVRFLVHDIQANGHVLQDPEMYDAMACMVRLMLAASTLLPHQNQLMNKITSVVESTMGRPLLLQLQYKLASYVQRTREAIQVSLATASTAAGTVAVASAVALVVTVMQVRASPKQMPPAVARHQAVEFVKPEFLAPTPSFKNGVVEGDHLASMVWTLYNHQLPQPPPRSGGALLPASQYNARPRSTNEKVLPFNGATAGNESRGLNGFNGINGMNGRRSIKGVNGTNATEEAHAEFPPEDDGHKQHYIQEHLHRQLRWSKEAFEDLKLNGDKHASSLPVDMKGPLQPQNGGSDLMQLQFDGDGSKERYVEEHFHRQLRWSKEAFEDLKLNGDIKLNGHKHTPSLPLDIEMQGMIQSSNGVAEDMHTRLHLEEDDRKELCLEVAFHRQLRWSKEAFGDLKLNGDKHAPSLPPDFPLQGFMHASKGMQDDGQPQMMHLDENDLKESYVEESLHRQLQWSKEACEEIKLNGLNGVKHALPLPLDLRMQGIVHSPNGVEEDLHTIHLDEDGHKPGHIEGHTHHSLRWSGQAFAMDQTMEPRLHPLNGVEQTMGITHPLNGVEQTVGIAHPLNGVDETVDPRLHPLNGVEHTVGIVHPLNGVDIVHPLNGIDNPVGIVHPLNGVDIVHPLNGVDIVHPLNGIDKPVGIVHPLNGVDIVHPLNGVDKRVGIVHAVNG
jgi:hypothetical protein